MGAEDQKEFTDFDLFEVYDRLSIIQQNLDQYVSKHKVIENYKHLQDKIDNAQELLGEVYQEVANMDGVPSPVEPKETKSSDSLNRKLLSFKVQYETKEKKPLMDNGYLKIGYFSAYDEYHLREVMKDDLGYYQPIFFIIT